MALIITSTEQKKLLIKGTEIELASIYLRIDFVARANGVSMDVNAVPYLNKQMFQIGNPVPVDISGLQLSLNLNPSTHSQSVETAHELMMGYLSQEGYTVISDLI